MKCKLFWPVFAGFLACSGFAVAAPAKKPAKVEKAPETRESAFAAAQKQSEALIAAFKSVQVSADGSMTDEQRAQNKAIFEKLDHFFARERLVGDPIAPHRAKLSADQLKRYEELFWKILRVSTYSSTGRSLNEATLSPMTPSSKEPGDLAPKTVTVSMSMDVEEKDFHMELAFLWEKIDADWLLVDLSFDGDSMMRDYQAQFGRILEKDGAEGLMKKLEDRYKDEVTAKGEL